MLVAQEAGRVLAGVPLLGVLPAAMLLDRAGSPHTAAAAPGELRVGWLPARPPSAKEPGWTVDPRLGLGARAPRRARASTATP